MSRQGIVVCRSSDRFLTRAEGMQTRHSFSFGDHYDPANTSSGLLVAHNDEILQPGKGYPMHLHRDLEIVTWVMSGALMHEDSTGSRALVRPGEVLRLSAGRGVEHAEFADRAAGATRFVQMWLSPAWGSEGNDPEIDCAAVRPGLRQGLPAVVVSGDMTRLGEGGLSIAQPGATLQVVRLGSGERLALPAAPFMHVFVALGSVTLLNQERAADVLETGDAVRLTGVARAELEGQLAAEVLMWEMHSER